MWVVEFALLSYFLCSFRFHIATVDGVGVDVFGDGERILFVSFLPDLIDGLNDVSIECFELCVWDSPVEIGRNYQSRF